MASTRDSLTDQPVLGTSARWHGRAVVVTVSGEIDHATAPTVAGIVEVVARDSPEMMVFDFTGVGFLSSAGLSVLLDALGRPGVGAVRVVATARAVTRPMTLLGIVSLIPIFGTLAESLGFSPGSTSAATEVTCSRTRQ